MLVLLVQHCYTLMLIFVYAMLCSVATLAQEQKSAFVTSCFLFPALPPCVNRVGVLLRATLGSPPL